MATNQQLEEMIIRVDTHHARVIKEVEDRLKEQVETLQNQVNHLMAEVQQLKTRK